MALSDLLHNDICLAHACLAGLPVACESSLWRQQRLQGSPGLLSSCIWPHFPHARPFGEPHPASLWLLVGFCFSTKCWTAPAYLGFLSQHCTVDSAQWAPLPLSSQSVNQRRAPWTVLIQPSLVSLRARGAGPSQVP